MNNFGELLSECWDSKSEEKLFEIKRTPDPDNLLETCRALEGKVPDDKDSEETKIKKLTEDEDGICPRCGNVLKSDDRGIHCPECDWHPGEPEEVEEGKVNEQDEPEDPEPSMPPEEEPKDEMPEPEPSADEEAPEITKEYIGRSEDTHFYMVSTETDEGLVEDLELVDQEGVKKYSAKDNNLDPAEVDNFIIQVIQDIEINEIERSVFMKYILPKILEEEEPEPEEEELEDDEKPEKEEKPEPEEEEPVESKKVEEGLTSVSDNAIFIDKASIGDGWQVLSTVEESNMATALFTFDTEEEAAEAGQKIADAIGGKFFGTDDPRRKGPKTRSMESKKILSEMKVVDGENNEFDVLLSDDGTLDTVIDINGSEFRFDAEFASLFRDEEGTLSEEGLEELALDALANLEEDEYNELIGAAKEDAAEEYDVSRDDKGKFYVTRGEKTVNGPFDTEEEARDAIRELEGAKEDVGESKGVNETVIIVDDPDPKLVELLKSGADGGKGEFEEFLPSDLEKEVKDRDATYVPSLMPDGKSVVWSEVSLDSPLRVKKIHASRIQVDEKKKPPVCKKCGKKHWPFEKCSVKKTEEKSEESQVVDNRAPEEKEEVNESYGSAYIEADIRRGLSREEIIRKIRTRYIDIGPKQAEQIYNAVESGKDADWSRWEEDEPVTKPEEETKESAEVDEAKMGVDYVKTLKKAVKDATTALKDKDYEAAAKALEDAADDASDGARAAKKMKRADDAKAEEEAKKEKEEEKPKEESVEEEKVEETKLDEKSWWKRILDDLRADSKFASLVKEHGLDSDEVHKYVSQHYFAQAVSKMAIDDVIRSAATDLPGPEDVDEKKKPPVCKKCNTAHWPFQKCGVAKKSKEKSEEGKVPDDKDSEQKKIDKLTEKDGKKKEAIKVEQRKPSLDESKSISCLKNLLNL